MKYFQIFLIEFAQKKFMIYQKPMLVFWKPGLRKTSLPPTAHICFDRSFVALSNVISHYVQSSLLIEFLGLENSAIKKGFQRPTTLRWFKKNFKYIDSDSPDDEESESIIRISLA